MILDEQDPIIVVATATARAGSAEAVESAIRQAIPEVHREAGCEKYALHRDRETGDFVMIERWASAADLDAHRAGAPFTELIAVLAGHLAAPLRVQRLSAVRAGLTAVGEV